MRYVRTKDGVYQSVFFKIGVDSKTGEEYLTGRDTKIHALNNKIINQANTIEELCDEFVWVDTLNNKTQVMPKEADHKGTKLGFGGVFEIYGAIRTKKVPSVWLK